MCIFFFFYSLFSRTAADSHHEAARHAVVASLSLRTFLLVSSHSSPSPSPSSRHLQHFLSLLSYPYCLSSWLLLLISHLPILSSQSSLASHHLLAPSCLPLPSSQPASHSKHNASPRSLHTCASSRLEFDLRFFTLTERVF